MRYSGQSIQCSMLEDNILELRFDLQGESVNKLNALTLQELREVIDQIKLDPSIKGLLVTSGKDVFIVGADVTEFPEKFKNSEAELSSWLLGVDRTFSDIEDLSFPSVVIINGMALGGGFELTLTGSFRVASMKAKVGLPETKLGIFPGFGGTVRLARLIGADNAIEWIASGEHYSADVALKMGAVDAVVAPENLRKASLDLLKTAMRGELDWRARQNEKISPLKLNPVEATMVFESAKGFVGKKAGPHYPSPLTAIEVIQKGATLSREQALVIEAETFAKIAKTQAARALVGIFLNDQTVKKTAKKMTKAARPLQGAAVLGAGIMGGGIAYQSAVMGIPIFMKDIQEKQMALGLSEAAKHLDKQVGRGKMTTQKMGEVLARIRSTFSYADFKIVDFVVEAVVENEQVKKTVLSEVEAAVREDTIIASNTSTISISLLAESLKRPENFCGMHFFNPVHRMPLVEVIRGKKSSETAVATTVAYALALGKTPVVVNDCAGFLVNRVLFPYFSGFANLICDGVDFQRVDRVMEKFGWPMGPAFLLDVVGIDTAHHAEAVMANAYPDRMKNPTRGPIDVMFSSQRFGQKNGNGFFTYQPEKKGPPKREVDLMTYDLLKPIIIENRDKSISDEDIVDRMMLPMILECARCLEDGIVGTPAEVDISLLYGLGFPAFRGGALMYADTVGLKNICARAEKFLPLGKLYEPCKSLVQFAQEGRDFYS